MNAHPRTGISRRSFLTGMLAAGVAPAFLPGHIWAKSPNDKINLGVIGLGRKGRSLMGGFMRYDDAQVVAISEVADIRLQDGVKQVDEKYAESKRSGTYKGCEGYRDFRELLKREDIDAVVIATPDHWHTIPSIMASNAGKDVYCEKPLTLTIEEGRVLTRVVRKNQTVFQTGSQQRCEFGGNFRKACEFVRSGRIGEVKTIRVGVGAPPKPCDLPTEPLPDGIDWNMWVGPSPMRGFNQILCPTDVHNHFPAFRDYREFANGRLADMGAHHFDIAQWGLDRDRSGPRHIIPPKEGDSGLKFIYDNGVEMFHGGRSGVTFEGTEGTIYVDRRSFESTPGSIIKSPLKDSEVHLENPGSSHLRNWLDCIRSRQTPIADVEIGSRTAAVCQLANIGYELRRDLEWDPKAEKFVGDAEANALRSRETRDPWTLG